MAGRGDKTRINHRLAGWEASSRREGARPEAELRPVSGGRRARRGSLYRDRGIRSKYANDFYWSNLESEVYFYGRALINPACAISRAILPGLSFKHVYCEMFAFSTFAAHTQLGPYFPSEHLEKLKGVIVFD